MCLFILLREFWFGVEYSFAVGIDAGIYMVYLLCLLSCTTC